MSKQIIFDNEEGFLIPERDYQYLYISCDPVDQMLDYEDLRYESEMTEEEINELLRP
jgi:hypothetical protein